VGLEWILVTRLDRARAHRERGIDVAPARVLLRGLGLLGAQPGIELVVSGPEHRRRIRPFDAELARRVDRLLLALAYHGEEVAAAHDLHQARELRALVHGNELRAGLRRAHHARMQHAGER
jgi:hypothetical protein